MQGLVRFAPVLAKYTVLATIVVSAPSDSLITSFSVELLQVIASHVKLIEVALEKSINVEDGTMNVAFPVTVILFPELFVNSVLTTWTVVPGEK